MSRPSEARTKIIGTCSLLTAILVIASVSTIGMIHTNDVFAAKIFLKEKFRDSFAFATKTINEGSITTRVDAQAITPISGDTQLCVFMTRVDDSTGTFLIDFLTCGPAQLTVTSGLSSATFSGTLTGFEFVSGEEKTVTVNSQLSATGKAQTTTSGSHFNSPDFTSVSHFNGLIRPASGSLNMAGDITFSTNDATGTIGNAKSGDILIQKN